jgi:hypothetical protein
MTILFRYKHPNPKQMFTCLHLNPKQMCHPDRSEAQWRDLQFREPLLEMFSTQCSGPAVPPTNPLLKLIPKVLVINVVVVLHLRRFHKRAQKPWALFDVASQQRIGPLSGMEIL